MPRWSPAEATDLARLFILGEAYANLLAVQRRGSKGLDLVVTDPFMWDTVDPTLEELIGIRDRRLDEDENWLSSFGAHFVNQTDQPPFYAGR